MSDRLLIVARHRESEWNKADRFTGLTDGRTEQGRREAETVGSLLAELRLGIGIAFTSIMQRTYATAQLIGAKLGEPDLEIVRNAALNERNYGRLTGMTRESARQKWSAEQVRVWRRSLLARPPDGESLRDVGARVWPFHFDVIIPHVMRGGGVLVVGHGNSLRALAMVLENRDPEGIVRGECETGIPYAYRLASDTRVVGWTRFLEQA